MTKNAATPDALWASGDGRLACRTHLPRPGSDGFWSRRWELVTPEWREGFTGARGTEPRCEACVAIDQIDAIDDATWQEPDRDAGSPAWNRDHGIGGVA